MGIFFLEFVDLVSCCPVRSRRCNWRSLALSGAFQILTRVHFRVHPHHHSQVNPFVADTDKDW
jgi:hypothetical protein